MTLVSGQITGTGDYPHLKSGVLEIAPGGLKPPCPPSGTGHLARAQHRVLLDDVGGLPG